MGGDIFNHFSQQTYVDVVQEFGLISGRAAFQWWFTVALAFHASL